MLWRSYKNGHLMSAESYRRLPKTTNCLSKLTECLSKLTVFSYFRLLWLHLVIALRYFCYFSYLSDTY